MIKTVIIEDEPNNMASLKRELTLCCDDISIIGEATSVKSGLRLLKKENVSPDIVFLDIDLPDGLVFDLLNKIRPFSFEIIFTTAHDEHAIKACEYSSIGYILKPIDQKKLRGAMDRFSLNQGAKMDERYGLLNTYLNNPNAIKKIAIPDKDGVNFVDVSSIIRLEADDNYTNFFMKDGSIIKASRTLKSYEDILLPVNFYRVHKSHIINFNCIDKWVKEDGGYLVMEDGHQISIARRKRAWFFEKMRRLRGGR